jgi:hypothetical protein
VCLCKHVEKRVFEGGEKAHLVDVEYRRDEVIVLELETRAAPTFPLSVWLPVSVHVPYSVIFLGFRRIKPIRRYRNNSDRVACIQQSCQCEQNIGHRLITFT